MKVLPAHLSADREFRARFDREAALSSTVSHPNIVDVYDRGEHDGQLWITMVFVDGTDAARLMRTHPGGVPAADVVEIAAAVGSALDYAHGKGLLHRDVKPANIMLSSSGSNGDERRIMLADFGIARTVDDTSDLTATNMTLGTVAYSAPEQLRGDADIDGRADQYALAASVYHLMTGTQLFGHTNPAVIISRHLSVQPPALADTHPHLAALDPVLRIALAKDPADRFGRCSDFARALSEQLCGNDARLATRLAPVPSTTAAGGTGARHQRGWALLGALAAAALVVASVLLLRPSSDQHPPQASTPPPTATQAVQPTTPASTLAPTTSGAVAAPTTSAIATTAPAPCVIGNEAPQVQEVMARFTAGDIVGGDYVSGLPLGVRGGNFDSCATLSAAAIAVVGGSGSTPVHWLLFHRGSYVGPATPKATSLVYLDESLTTDDTVVLKYGSGGSCMACPDRTFTIVRFQWQGDHVEMIGTPPGMMPR